MNDEIKQALEKDLTIDIITTGAKQENSEPLKSGL